MSRDDEDEGHVFSDVKIVHQTDRAIKVKLDDEREIWVPKSVIHDNSEIWKVEEEGDLMVKRWWAEKEGHA